MNKRTYNSIHSMTFLMAPLYILHPFILVFLFILSISSVVFHRRHCYCHFLFSSLLLLFLLISFNRMVWKSSKLEIIWWYWTHTQTHTLLSWLIKKIVFRVEVDRGSFSMHGNWTVHSKCIEVVLFAATPVYKYFSLTSSVYCNYFVRFRMCCHSSNIDTLFTKTLSDLHSERCVCVCANIFIILQYLFMNWITQTLSILGYLWNVIIWNRF